MPITAKTAVTADPNRRFIRRVMTEPLLTPAEELRLARQWREQTDERALHRLTTAYMRLVVAMAHRFRHYGLPVGDLVQEGSIGLMEAARRFEPEREVRFSTYATWWIRAAIQDHVLRNWSIVRTGTTASHKALFFNLRRLREKLDRGSVGPLTAAGRAAIATALDVSVRDVELMEGRLSGADRSLNTPIGDDADSNWQDHLVCERPDPEQTVTERHDGAIRAGWLARAMGELNPRERLIVGARCLADEIATLESLGRRLGVSKERVRQLESQALGKLRRSVHRAAVSAGAL